MEIDLKNENSELLLRQANIISKGLYDVSMTPTAFKLIRYGLYLVQELSKSISLNDNNNEVEFSVSDFCKCLGISQGGNTTEIIKKSLDEVASSKIKIESGSENKNKMYVVYNWVYTAETDYKTIIIRFNPDLIKVMKDNLTQYSTLELKAVGKLKNIYALRIYELLKSFYNTKGKAKFKMASGEWRTQFYTIDYLREYFNTQEKYPAEASFIQKCIKFPINEINKVAEKFNLNFTVSYELKKVGKLKQIQFIGNDVISKNSLEFNKNDTPEEHKEKVEEIKENLELENFKKKYSPEEWEEIRKAVKETNPLFQNSDNDFLDIFIYQSLKDKK